MLCLITACLLDSGSPDQDSGTNEAIGLSRGPATLSKKREKEGRGGGEIIEHQPPLMKMKKKMDYHYQ